MQDWTQEISSSPRGCKLCVCVCVYTCAIDPKFIRMRMCLRVHFVTSQAFGRHPMYSKYYDKTGVLVRKDDDFECWWAGSHFLSLP
jgi:hypothetical protein